MIDKNNLDQAQNKLPPQNTEAEESTLGSLMIDKNAIAKIADSLYPEDFYKPQHRIVYEAILDLYKKNAPIDVLSVTNRLKEKKLLEEVGGASFLTSLVNKTPSSAHIAHYSQIVHEKRVLRDLISASYKIAELGWQESENINDVLDRAEQTIFSISQKSIAYDFITLKEELVKAFDRIDQLHKGGDKLRGISTGFNDLDNKLAGLQKSDLVIIGGRPSLGKTSFALDIARHAALKEKAPVGIFSLEMSKEQVVDRIISAESTVDLWKIRTGTLSTEGETNDFNLIQDALSRLAEAPIFIDDIPSPTVMQIRTMARRLQAQVNLGMIIIDYIQLIAPSLSRESTVQQYSEISRSLKALARELNVPVVALSQLSRAVEQRGPLCIPRLSDLRETGCVTGDTLIQRRDTGEVIPIKEVVNNKKPIPIFSLDKNLKLKKTYISKVFSSGKKLVYEIKTRSGRIIKASANHPFLKVGAWVRLDNLEIGDQIALPRIIPQPEKTVKLKKEEIILLAHLLGDGCILPNRPFHYTSADKKSIKAVKESAEKLFKIKGKIIKQKDWYHIYLPSPYHLTHNKHHPITNWLSKLGIKLSHSYEKEIPKILSKCSNKDISLFLNNLWSTDGTLYPDYKSGYVLYYSSTSEKLIRETQHLLLRFGILSTIRKSKKKNYRINFNLYIQGMENQLKFLKNIGIFGEKSKIVKKAIKDLENTSSNPNFDVISKEIWKDIAVLKEKYNLSWRDFARKYGMSYCGSTLFKCGISRKRMARIVNFIPELKLKNLANSDIYWDKIVSITPLEIEETYDATVPKTHNFIANDIIIHNSLEQDADVVMFVYREDRYKEETDKQNIAEIRIAKHRNGPLGVVNLFFNEQLASFRNLEKEEDIYEPEE